MKTATGVSLGGALLLCAFSAAAQPATADEAAPEAAAEGCAPYDSDFSQYEPYNFIGAAETNLIASEIKGIPVAILRPGSKREAHFSTGPLDCAKFSEIRIEFYVYMPKVHKPAEWFGLEIEYGDQTVEGTVNAAGYVATDGNLWSFKGVKATIDGGELQTKVAVTYVLTVVAGRNKNMVYYLNGEHVTTLAHDDQVKAITLSGLGPEEVLLSVKVR